MDPNSLPTLLGLATLLPLASFFILLAMGPRFGKSSGHGAYIAVGAIVLSGVLSFLSLFIWLGHHFPVSASHHDQPALAAADDHAGAIPGAAGQGGEHAATDDALAAGAGGEAATGGSDAGHTAEGNAAASHTGEPPVAYTGNYYLLGHFGELELWIGYYIDSLTIVMFCMVTLIASCIHFYSIGYMHDELDEVTDHEVTLDNGEHLKRPGRNSRFFQYMSLFSFSMLGLVLSGNIVMVFVFWELVGICSYFLIGFYVERKSASNAANKAFIVNRIGDFGMLIGLMALWSSLGTFNFGDVRSLDASGQPHTRAGLFTLVRAGQDHALRVPEGMVRWEARDEIAAIARNLGPDATPEQLETEIAGRVDGWRAGGPRGGTPYGYTLLVVAGIGIFCGCVGKSAQFPLHVWLPDAMEGPTPVSALVHSATMVAAGVYLVGRFYPVLAPEVLLVIAVVGLITLLMAATIAITATDIKRVLAYSTVSQLGYMMLALGVGGWLAGMLHLVTHAFFKSLLFLGSGSVIHAVHTNEMTAMGGLRRKLPITAYTMLVGCLAIAGISIPFVIGFSGYYSKDKILEQAFVFRDFNGGTWWAPVFFYGALGGAVITAFYMFRMWYLTFAGQPRDKHRYDHAHESPRVMYVPLIILAVFATGIAWQPISGLGKFSDLSLVNLLEASRPRGTLSDTNGVLVPQVWPNEHFAHQEAQFASVVWPVTWLATLASLAGIALATAMYAFGALRPAEVRRQFEPLYQFLWHKWWFDELYQWTVIRPTLVIGRWVAAFDRRVIDGALDGLAVLTRGFASVWDRVADRTVIDGSIDLLARRLYATGLGFRGLQTGVLRQYVMFLVMGALALYVVISFFWSSSLAG